MDYQLGPGPLQVDQNTIDEKIKSDIGIVENGDVATHAITKGYYVIWKGDLYIAKTDISSGTTLSAASSGNLTAKPSGLGAEVAALNSNIILLRKKSSISKSVASKGTTVFSYGDDGFAPDTIPGYTIITAIATTNHDLVTLGVNNIANNPERWSVTAYNYHSSAQDCIITVTYIYVRS